MAGKPMKHLLSFAKRCSRPPIRVAGLVLLVGSLSTSAWAQVQTQMQAAVAASAPPDTDPGSSLSIPAEVPLRLEITQTLTLQAGRAFRGKLIEPIYGPNRL